MRLTMINPATIWFKIVELPTVAQKTTVPPADKGKKVTFDKNTKVAEPYFDKSSAQISNLVYKAWFSRYPCRSPETYHGQTVVALAHRHRQTTNNVDRELTKLP